jgi:uncharacterized protein YuzE
MKITNDSQADALYIEFGSATPTFGIDIADLPGVSVDVDKDGLLLGIEIITASERMDLSSLSELGFVDLVSGKSAVLTLNSLPTDEPDAEKVP